MGSKGNFFFLTILFFTAFISNAQEISLYPLSQYSVGAGTQENIQLRTTATLQQDTLKIPYIEDFSGSGLPIDSISVDVFSTSPIVFVYRITHLKMHGLKSGAGIRVFNATGGEAAVALLDGPKYVKVINKYAFQLFNDAALTIPAKVIAGRMTYCNWVRTGSGGYSSKPDTLGFLNNNGGVYINSDMALNPINIGVATFDGVDYRGTPYSNTTAKGYGDNLTSLPFDLSSYGSSDSIYMSFYWQSKSLGDDPIASEFLALEFKDTSTIDTWVEVWKQFGNIQTEDTFNIVMLPIIDSAYLHKGFQYRFRSYGVINGRFNVWNLDYIYIDTNRRKINPYLKDVTIISTNISALENYTSVPYKHIRNLPAAIITSETAQAFMKIRDSLILYGIERKHLIRDNNLGNDDTIKFQNEPDPSIQKYVFTQNFTDTIPGGEMGEPYVLKEEFFFQPLDTIGPIDLTFNNFTSIETYFYDYYSYDDGIPEWSLFSYNAGGTRVANAYKILKSDEVTHIDYCFLKNNGVDMTNTNIFLNIWKESPNVQNPLVNQLISIKYSSVINGFVRYELTNPITLDSGATYYFGYTQNTPNGLFIGYDKNNDRLDKIFYSNDGSTWQPFSNNNPVPGSLMIRPVFSDNEIITSTKNEQLQQNQFEFYPNPAQDELHFTGHPESISIYDLAGLLLLEEDVEGKEVLSTRNLTNGLYLIILSKGDYQEVKRLIIQK